MKKLIYLLAIAAIAVITVVAAPKGQTGRDDKEKGWITVDSLEAQGLYRSALIRVEKIYDESKRQADLENEIRALIYRLKYTAELEEEGPEKAIEILENELPDPRLAASALKHTMLAELYQRYYGANRWEINQREGEAEKRELRFWGPQMFYDAILEQYRLSLASPDQLSAISTGSLRGILSGSLQDTVNSPFLYDILIRRALEFLNSSDEYPVSALRPSILCSDELFLKPDRFITAVSGQELNSSDPWCQALRWYGDWLSYSGSNIQPDLMRLRYVHEESCLPERDSLYEAALLDKLPMVDRRNDQAILHEALAEYHLQKSADYVVNGEDTLKYKGERRKAKEWLEKGVQLEETRSGKNCRNLLTSLLSSELTAQSESVQIPGKFFPVSVEYRNVHGLYYRIYRVPAMVYQTEWTNLDTEAKQNRLAALKPVRTGYTTLPDNGDMNPHRVNILMEPLDAGFYLISLADQQVWRSPATTAVVIPVSVSRITLISNQQSKGSRAFYCRDRLTGAALEGITVVPWYTSFNPDERRYELSRGTSCRSGQQGYVSIRDGGPGRDNPSPQAYRLQMIKNQDTLLTEESFYPGYQPGSKPITTSVVLYTDRKLYKPGSELFFRGVMIDQKGDSLMIHSQDSIELNLQDPRYQVLQKIKLHVDRMGVFSGSLTLPVKGLTGSYILQSRFGSASFNMEHYRRPSFAIALNDGHKTWQNGDRIEISGKVTALSGEPVPGAEVVVETNLQPRFMPRRWYPSAGRKIWLNTVNVLTDQNGCFHWKWNSIPEENNPLGAGTLLTYEITFSATDPNGETHQEKVSVFTGKGSAEFSAHLPDRVSAGDTVTASIRTLSPDGRWLTVPVRAAFSRLKGPACTLVTSLLPEPDRFLVTKKEWTKKLPLLPYRNENLVRNYPVDAVLYETNLLSDSASSIRFPTGENWKEGWYRVEFSSDDPSVSGKVCQYFFIVQPDSRTIPAEMDWFAELSADHARVGDTLELQLATAGQGFVFTGLQLPGGDAFPDWIESGKRKQTTTWTVKPDWQGGAMIRLILFRNNRLYEKEIRISVPWQNKKLILSGLDAVGQVKPGDSVVLRLKVTDESNRPVRASLGITVYDASLDKIKPFGWPVPAWPTFNGRPAFSALRTGISGSDLLFVPQAEWIEVTVPEPLVLNWWGMSYAGINRLEVPMMMKTEAGAGARVGKASEDAVAADGIESAGIPAAEPPVANVPVSFRSDFRETALFNGRLESDGQGVAEVRFKVPEVFTEWKILVAGHTADLATGLAEHHFRSSKELMLKPNFPSFIRKGDTLSFAVRLGWYGTHPVDPVIRLALQDLSGNPIKTWDPVTRHLNQGDVSLMTWDYTADVVRNVQYQLSAADGSDQDGMTDTLNVYPDRVELWRSHPFFLNRPGSKKLQLSGDPREAILEVTTTPAWQVLESLPVVLGKERDCSEYWFSRLYLAAVAGSIADRIPGMAAFFLDNPPEAILDSLYHPLLRNREVKKTGWDETPWSRLEANEKARILQIREWMDPLKRNYEIAHILEKIEDLQNADGTWPWFRGMGTDWFITQQILAGFGELKVWRILDVTATQRGRNMITHAVEAMDKWMSREYSAILKLDSASRMKVQLSPMLIHYLYARSFYIGLSMSAKDEIAWIHFTQRIPLEWIHHDPGLQALMAISAVQTGKKDVAVPVFRSLKERIMQSDEMGSYWPRKGFASSWYQWDLWMQSRMIELYAVMGEDQKEIDQLRLYLIHQKRGRDWGNGMVASWAAKSLLLYGSDVTDQPARVGIKWGKETFSPLRIKTGGTGPSGYYRYAWNDASSIPVARTVELSHEGGSPAWGTLFIREDHRLDELSSTEGPLKASRDVMVQDSKGIWTKISENEPVKVGQRLRIRITVSTDRELSYVELKDFLGTGCVPEKVLSGYFHKEGLSWYQARDPESVIFYVTWLPKGRHTLEYTAVAEQAGRYFGGYATVQCLYAPEFRAWSASVRIHTER